MKAHPPLACTSSSAPHPDTWSPQLVFDLGDSPPDTFLPPLVCSSAPPKPWPGSLRWASGCLMDPS